jgi:hypothetical protein
MVRYTAYRRIYEKLSFLTRPRWQNGRILRPSRAMSGSAGLCPSRNRKPEGSTLSVYARNLKKDAPLICGLFLGRQASMPTELHPRKPRPPFDPTMFGLVLGSRLVFSNATVLASVWQGRSIQLDLDTCFGLFSPTETLLPILSFIREW